MFRGFVISFLLLAPLAAHADDALAARVSKRYDLEKSKWELETVSAVTPEERARAATKRPDITPYLKEMWAAIRPHLAEPWTLPHAAWFLRAAPGVLKTGENGVPVPIFTAEIEAIRTAIEKSHIKSPALTPVCMALVSFQDPRSLDTLRKIEKQNPDAKIQGVAALGAAMVMKSLGDEPAIMRERITCLRDAIIKSADVELGGTTVAKLAENELYIIRFLSKGRIAPDLEGLNSNGQPMKLSAEAGKVVLLLFWGSDVLDAEHTVKITNDLARKFSGRPFTVIGVSRDQPMKLKALESDGTVAWKNFSDADGKLAGQFRVGSWPVAYVLDGSRKIHYTGAPGSFAELTAEALLPETGNN